MKPQFALKFTDTSIMLLHRAAGNWAEVGETPIDTPDLAAAMAKLRDAALKLAPDGFTSELIIPDSQILYTEITPTGAPDADRSGIIAQALARQTPYRADEIAFDWLESEDSIKVAAVARLTLQEAEDFARQHGFNPARFTAAPDQATFAKAPQFGLTLGTEALVPDGKFTDEVEVSTPDPAPQDAAGTIQIPPEPGAEPAPAKAGVLDISETSSLDAADEPSAEIALPESVGTMTDAPSATPVAVKPEALPQALASLLDQADTSHQPPILEDVTEAPFIHVPQEAAFPEIDRITHTRPDIIEEEVGEEIEPAGEQEDSVPDPGASPVETLSDDPANDAAAESTDPEPAVESVPETLTESEITVDSVQISSPAADLIIPIPADAAGPPVLPPDAIPDSQPAIAIPSRSPAPSGSHRKIEVIRDGRITDRHKPSGGLARQATEKPLPASFQDPPPLSASRSALSSPAHGTQRETAAASTAMRSEMRHETQPNHAPDPARRAGTTSPPIPVRPRPHRRQRHLGIILTAILLVCLAAIGAWSSLYLASSGDQTDTTAARTEADPADAAQVPALTDSGRNSDEPVISPLPGGSAAAPPEAAATVPLPDEIATPPPDNPQNRIALRDSGLPPALDTPVLPEPDIGSDIAPESQMSPPAFGTVYSFDADGLIKPVPEGIPSPDGYMIYAGKPKTIPPSRSATAADAAKQQAAPENGATAPDDGGNAAASAPAPAPAPTPAEGAAAPEAVSQPDPDLADRRPLARPAALAQPEEVTTADIPPEPLAKNASANTPRPTARPASIMAMAEKAASEDIPAPAAEARPLPNAAASLAAGIVGNASAIAPARAAEPASQSNPAAQTNSAAIAFSQRPAERPRMTASQNVAVASAAVAPQPQIQPRIQPQPQPAASAPAPAAAPAPAPAPTAPASVPRLPANANVAQSATIKKGINLSAVSLIGVYGSDSNRYALIRNKNGRIDKVRIGDNVDGGQVVAITHNELRYQKGRKLQAISLPQ